MESLPQFYIKVLEILSVRYGLACTLEEMTSLLTPAMNAKKTFTGNMFPDQQKQATVLDALLVLNEKGLLILNPNTDKSSITIKGLIAVNSKVLWN